MGDDVVRLSAVGAIARRRWRLLVAFALVGAVIGFGLSFVLSPGYSASSKILLRGQPDDNQLATEAQIAMSLAVLDRVADELQWGRTGVQLQSGVTATVLDGNVLEIVGMASTPDRARELTDHVAAAYVAESTSISDDTRSAVAAAAKQRRDAAQKRVDDLRDRLTQAQGSGASPQDTAAVAQLSSAFATAQSELAQLDDDDAARPADRSSTKASVLEPALDGGAAAPSRVQLVGGGALAAVLLGLYGLLRSRRNSRRPGDPEQIAATLGAPVVASVVVPAEAAAVGDTGGPPESAPASSTGPGLLVRLFDDELDDATAVVPHPAGEAIRYRRALGRVGSGPDGSVRLLVLVPSGDGAARAAVAELAGVAAADGPLRLVVDDAGSAETYRQLIGPNRNVEIATGSWSASEPAVLRVATVAPTRPTVPDDGPASDVLVAFAARTRTTAELVDLASASLDAGRPVTGVLVVAVGRPVTGSQTQGRRPRRPVAESVPRDGQMVGSS